MEAKIPLGVVAIALVMSVYYLVGAPLTLSEVLLTWIATNTFIGDSK